MFQIVVCPPAFQCGDYHGQVTAEGASKVLSVELPADPTRVPLTNESIQLAADNRPLRTSLIRASFGGRS